MQRPRFSALCLPLLCLPALILPLMPAQASAEAIRVSVHFDDASRAALEKAKEKVTISAFFYGNPAPGVPVDDESGQIFLSIEELTVWPKDQTVSLGQTLEGAPIKDVEEPYLNVNIYSARHVLEDNILNCSLVDDRVAALRGAVQTITCKLING